MEKVLKWINKHKRLSVLVIVIIIFMPIIVIHFLFKIRTGCYLITAELCGYLSNAKSQ